VQLIDAGQMLPLGVPLVLPTVTWTAAPADATEMAALANNVPTVDTTSRTNRDVNL
jgi:hypothetical protein